jgi:hypothetical protein
MDGDGVLDLWATTVQGVLGQRPARHPYASDAHQLLRDLRQLDLDPAEAVPHLARAFAEAWAAGERWARRPGDGAPWFGQFVRVIDRCRGWAAPRIVQPPAPDWPEAPRLALVPDEVPEIEPIPVQDFNGFEQGVQALVSEICPSKHEIWVKPAAPAGVQDGVPRILFPSVYYADWWSEQGYAERWLRGAQAAGFDWSEVHLVAEGAATTRVVAGRAQQRAGAGQ